MVPNAGVRTAALPWPELREGSRQVGVVFMIVWVRLRKGFGQSEQANYWAYSAVSVTRVRLNVPRTLNCFRTVLAARYEMVSA